MTDELRPIMFDPRYSWDCMLDRISDAYGRAAAQLDWAVWDAELDLEQAPRPRSSSALFIGC